MDFAKLNSKFLRSLFLAVVSLAFFVGLPTGLAKSLGGNIREARVLIIGDSHSEGSFGGELYRLFESQAHRQVDAYAVGGSTPLHWLQGLRGDWGYWEKHSGEPEIRSTKPITPQLKGILERRKYQLVIIEQGANYLWRDEGPIRTEVKQLLALLNAESVVQCVWAGPPSIGKKISAVDSQIATQFQAKILRIRDSIQAEVKASRCQWIDSLPMTKYPDTGGDGIHYDRALPEGPSRAKNWAKEVFGQIQN